MARQMVPRSHRWPKERQALPEEVLSAAMPKGSLLVWLGGTLHAAGPNQIHDEWRSGLFLSYSLGWLKTVENQKLDIPLAVARTLSPELRALVGGRPLLWRATAPLAFRMPPPHPRPTPTPIATTTTTTTTTNNGSPF